ncbi:Arylsulfatase A [Parapedobacter composti]|uniref:Arylsulfatase A n=2 Tax=Parapedobacter composti TaxID=623281 RepID=A0A1I1E4K5_9SPHI|nr:Arylsulfatase A [Parapedobacter composti]
MFLMPTSVMGLKCNNHMQGKKKWKHWMRGCMAITAMLAIMPMAMEVQAQHTAKPNIVIIYVDDLGYGDLGCYGGDIPTPNIDRIAKQGIRFTDFYVSAPACTPSRYSMLTGRYPQRSMHGLTRALMPVDTQYLDTAEKTLAYYLQAQGYHTALFGKWHLGVNDSTQTLKAHGFEEFVGFLGGCVDYFTHGYGPMGHDWSVNGEQRREEGYATDLITDYAVRFIANRGRGESQPFMALLAYNAPHYGKTDPSHIVPHTIALSHGKYQGYNVINSLQAPQSYVQKAAAIEDPYRRAYAAMVMNLDDNIGRVLEGLEKQGVLQNTMVWFISDNGGYSESFFGHADNGGLRGEKGTIWEGGIRVPAMVMWNDGISGDKVVDVPVCNIDLLPTLANLTGFQEHIEFNRIDGIAISDVLFGSLEMPERPLYWRYRKQTALRQGDWKLVNGKELYNLRSDRAEASDLATVYPEKVSELRARFKQIEGRFTQGSTECDRRSAEDYEVVAGDAAWCWFSDPRAIYHKGSREQIFYGYVNSKGDVVIGARDLSTKTVETFVLHERLQVDDHNVPAILALSDGHLLAFYTEHNGRFFMRKSKRPGDISAWHEERVIPFGGSRITYAHPVMLSGEGNRIYVFWRGSDWQQTFAFSDDDGDTWSRPQVLLASEGTRNRPYLKVSSDGHNRIDFIFTDGHPGVEPTNSVYHMYYEQGAFYQTDGSRISDVAQLPLSRKAIGKVYDGRASGVRSWIADVALNSQGNPVVCYMRYPKDTDHRYHYAWWDGKQWVDEEICRAGGWMPRVAPNERVKEPHYSGGIVLDHSDANHVYLSREVGGCFEIAHYTRQDTEWHSCLLTEGSLTDSVRPYAVKMPTGQPPVVLWMTGHYSHYTEFDTELRINAVKVNKKREQE